MESAPLQPNSVLQIECAALDFRADADLVDAPTWAIEAKFRIAAYAPFGLRVRLGAR